MLEKFQNNHDKDAFINFYKQEQHPNLTHREPNMDTKHYKYDRVRDDYCKFTMNLTRYSSTEACKPELGRFPVSNKIWSMVAQYWTRMEQGKPYPLVNEVFDIQV